MTELINQLVEEIEEIMPKRVYEVYVFEQYKKKRRSIHRTRKGAFKMIFGKEIDGELNKWYPVERLSNMYYDYYMKVVETGVLE